MKKTETEVINHLSIELTRTQMINRAIITVLERKNILTEQEILDEMEIIISDTIESYSNKFKKQFEQEEELRNKSSFLNFNKIGKA